MGYHYLSGFYRDELTGAWPAGSLSEFLSCNQVSAGTAVEHSPTEPDVQDDAFTHTSGASGFCHEAGTSYSAFLHGNAGLRKTEAKAADPWKPRPGPGLASFCMCSIGQSHVRPPRFKSRNRPRSFIGEYERMCGHLICYREVKQLTQGHTANKSQS